MDDDMTPVPGPVRAPDPRHVALGFALEFHRPEGRGYGEDPDTILATADKIHDWINRPGKHEASGDQGATGFGYTPGWALHLQRMIQQVLNRMGVEMATIADIQNTVQEMAAEDGVIIAALDDLKSKVAGGGTVSAADLDGVNNTIKAELTKLQDAVNRDDPATPNPSPGPVPTPNPAPTGP